MSQTRKTLLPAALIAAAALAAYHNSLHAPFVFDDAGSIVENPTLRHLWPLWGALSPPAGGMPVSGRPVLNLSFAVNYALGGLNVWGYHATNLAIHILAGLTLFGILRRTLLRGQGSYCDVAPRDTTIRALTPLLTPWNQNTGWKPAPLFLAFAIALIWTLHPLQTESVTYISQRAESLMGLFYFLTIYGFIRYADEKTESEKRKAETVKRSGFPLSDFRFPLLSVAACLLGMATKEVMATAPVIVLLYDRTFISGTFREAWKRRWRYYLGLGCTWILLAALVAETGSRGGTAGFGGALSGSTYALTQIRAITHYLRLSVWPYPLMFYYGPTLGGSVGKLVVGSLVLGGLLAGTLYLLFWPGPEEPGIVGDGVLLRPEERGFGGQALGFAGACFFLILAPSSSVVPVATETIAEHRMYLPLAAVIAVVVCGAAALLQKAGVGRNQRSPVRRSSGLRSVGGALLAVAVITCGFLTVRRNEAYSSDYNLWKDTVAKMPENSVAHNNLGYALLQEGDVAGAIGQCREALRIDPSNAKAHSNLGDALARAGRDSEALGQYEEALRLLPGDPETQNNLALALARAGRLPEAIAHYRESIRLKPYLPEVHNNLGLALASIGDGADAIDEYGQALRLRPDYAEAEYNLGNTLAMSGRLLEGVSHLEKALELKPDFPGAHNNLGCALAQMGRTAEARREFEAALRLNPDNAEARGNLGRLPAAP